MFLTECKIILPAHDNDGESLMCVHDALKAKLAEEFGGYTVVYAIGGWKPLVGTVIEEAVRVYSFAVDYGSNSIWEWLRETAHELCREARQDAVYIQVGVTAEIVSAQTS